MNFHEGLFRPPVTKEQAPNSRVTTYVIVLISESSDCPLSLYSTVSFSARHMKQINVCQN